MDGSPNFVLLTAVIVCAMAAEARDARHLFILSGQSNMARMNPALSFTPIVEHEFGAANVIVVHDALGGRSIRHWFKDWKPSVGPAPQDNGELYDRLMDKVRRALGGTRPETVTFIWMQGENDAKGRHANEYEASLQGLLDQLRCDLRRNDLNFVIGRINDHGLDKEFADDWKCVRNIQMRVADEHPRGAWVDTDDLNDVEKDGVVVQDLHLTPEGYRLLGERFARKAIELIRRHERTTP